MIEIGDCEGKLVRVAQALSVPSREGMIKAVVVVDGEKTRRGRDNGGPAEQDGSTEKHRLT